MPFRKKYRFKLQFGLRFLLILTFLVGIGIWTWSRVKQHRERRIWEALELTKKHRNAAFSDWRRAHQALRPDQPETVVEEQAHRKRYYSARTESDAAMKAMLEYYGAKAGKEIPMPALRVNGNKRRP